MPTDQAAAMVPYTVNVTVEDGRVVLRCDPDGSEPWLLSMTPAAAAHLSLALVACAGHAEEREGG